MKRQLLALQIVIGSLAVLLVALLAGPSLESRLNLARAQEYTTPTPPAGAGAITGTLPAGSTELPKESLGSGFAVGTVIIINPGGPNEERATIVSIGSTVVLAAPTKFEHAPGEKIAIVAPSAPATGTGPNPDGSLLRTELIVLAGIAVVFGVTFVAARRRG